METEYRQVEMISGKYWVDVLLEITEQRIYFKFKYNKRLMAEIKAMKNAK